MSRAGPVSCTFTSPGHWTATYFVDLSGGSGYLVNGHWGPGHYTFSLPLAKSGTDQFNYSVPSISVFGGQSYHDVIVPVSAGAVTFEEGSNCPSHP